MAEVVVTNDKKYRMVALDLDGTLLNSRGKLSEATKKYLEYLDEKGFVIILATGRPIATTYETIAALNLPHPIPVVCSNGAQGMLCWTSPDDGTATTGENSVKVTVTPQNNLTTKPTDAKNFIVSKELLFSTPVPENVVKRTIELAKTKGYVTQYYTDGGEIFTDPREAHHFGLARKYYALTGKKSVFVKDDDFEQIIVEKGLPSKLLVLCRTDQQEAMIELFKKEFSQKEYLIKGKSPSIVRGDRGWYMEILHPEVTKGHGLLRMCKHLGIPIKQCIAFGDADNDYEFLYLAGKGFAMKNARKIAKHIADEVIKYSNDNDGVIRTLHRMEQDGELEFPSANNAEESPPESPPIEISRRRSISF